MIEPSSLPPITLALLVLVIAFLYASVGFGGASGYLAAMSLFSIPPEVMASTALTLNILVSGVAFLAYYRARHFVPKLLLPFLLTSLPAAFIGGYIQIEAQIYFALLYVTLSYVAFRMLLFDDGGKKPSKLPPSRAIALISGGIIGLLSGILGIGGGIFLSPLIIIAGWGSHKQAAASAAAFILVNSISSVLGRMIGGNMVLGVMGLTLLPMGLVGALGGGYLGARYLSGTGLRRLLGIILLLAVARYLIGLFT
ncbi:MAG TPA: TSUP family transporter [Anaerolineales bacterium]